MSGLDPGNGSSMMLRIDVPALVARPDCNEKTRTMTLKHRHQENLQGAKGTVISG